MFVFQPQFSAFICLLFCLSVPFFGELRVDCGINNILEEQEEETGFDGNWEARLCLKPIVIIGVDFSTLCVWSTTWMLNEIGWLTMPGMLHRHHHHLHHDCHHPCDTQKCILKSIWKFGLVPAYLNNFCAGCDVLPDGHPVLLLVEHWQVVVHVDQVHHHLGVAIIEPTLSSSPQQYHHHFCCSLFHDSTTKITNKYRRKISTFAVADCRAPPTSSATTCTNHFSLFQTNSSSLKSCIEVFSFEILWFPNLSNWGQSWACTCASL